jgi:hypothetical protein
MSLFLEFFLYLDLVGHQKLSLEVLNYKEFDDSKISILNTIFRKLTDQGQAVQLFIKTANSYHSIRSNERLTLSLLPDIGVRVDARSKMSNTTETASAILGVYFSYSEFITNLPTPAQDFRSKVNLLYTGSQFIFGQDNRGVLDYMQSAFDQNAQVVYQLYCDSHSQFANKAISSEDLFAKAFQFKAGDLVYIYFNIKGKPTKNSDQEIATSIQGAVIGTITEVNFEQKTLEIKYLPPREGNKAATPQWMSFKAEEVYKIALLKADDFSTSLPLSN